MWHGHPAREYHGLEARVTNLGMHTGLGSLVTMPVDPVRDAAVDVLQRVFVKRMFLDDAIDRTLRRKTLSERGRRFLSQVCYGTVRNRGLADHILAGIVRGSINELPPPILNILRMGVYQALFLNQVTFPAMVHTSVDLAKKRGHTGTARLVNAVLKRVPETLDDVQLPSKEKDLIDYLSVRYSFPTWLLKRWRNELGDELEAFCVACNTEAPAVVRTNLLKTTPEKLIQIAAKSGCQLQKMTDVPEELTVISGKSPFRLKAFEQGLFTLQDPASMLVSHLLAPEPGERIAELCAAPGGKATHCAELTGDRGMVAALDYRWQRLHRVSENVERLGLRSVHPVCAEGTQPPLLDGFDRVLVDAPCSGLGTLRRNPDLRWRIDPKAPARLAETQQALLRSALNLCKIGGVVVYSVCTMTTEETRGVIEGILAGGLAKLEDGPELLAPWKIDDGQHQTLPHRHGMDGFYLTRLRRVS